MNRIWRSLRVTLGSLIPAGVVGLLLTSGVYRSDVGITLYQQLAAKPQFRCVGEVRITGNGPAQTVASCVLISDRYVISSAHPFIAETRKDTSFLFHGMRVETYVVTGRYAEKPSRFRIFFGDKICLVKRIILFDPALKRLNNDLAILELSEPVRGIDPAVVNNCPDERGDTATGVGFGAVSPGDRPNLGEQKYLKLAGENVLDSLGGYTYELQLAVLYADFDHPDTSRHFNRCGSPFPLKMEYLTSTGDSGGGLFRFREGRWELIGICRGSDLDLSQLLQTGFYGQVAGWTRLSLYYEWIMRTIG